MSIISNYITKKIFVISLLIIITTTSFIGCSAFDTSSKKSEANVSVEEDKDVFSSEKNLFSVEVTLPSDFFEGEDMTTLEKRAKENGIDEVKINDNGSVSYKMDKGTHRKLLKGLKKGVDESLFNPIEGLSVLGYYLMGNLYQAMNGVASEDINTTVNFINKDTKEIIKSGNSTDLGNN